MPAPHYVVFYNGAEDQPEREIVKLSDSYTFQDGGEPPCLETVSYTHLFDADRISDNAYIGRAAARITLYVQE